MQNDLLYNPVFIYFNFTIINREEQFRFLFELNKSHMCELLCARYNSKMIDREKMVGNNCRVSFDHFHIPRMDRERSVEFLCPRDRIKHTHTHTHIHIDIHTNTYT